MDKYGILKHYFGYNSFRPGQEKLVDAILAGQDVLGIMPTGAGKSLCYQVPALLMSGITLVVSPLISLMKDQVGALNQAGVHAAYINSSLTDNQITKALAFAKQGRYKIIYVAPERLETWGFLDFATHVEISMITVDEAHCISQWGQDFRPSYLNILSFVKKLARRPIISAFTATATSKVRDDILQILSLERPVILTTGFDRSNLTFIVEKPMVKRRFLRSWLPEQNGCGIIYCATQKQTEEVCNDLNAWGYPAGRYHAGLTMEERQRNQNAFIKNELQVMVATNAFGMGIDKPDVRFVLHYTLPLDVEGYYQEAGRAGRDGLPAKCVLLFERRDIMQQRQLLEYSCEQRESSAEDKKLWLTNAYQRLRDMESYCFTRGCLRKYLLTYFGQETNDRCGNCSNCSGSN